jgi:DNA polymerase III sliding clamp (beta) subunit (PCNA family)
MRRDDLLEKLDKIAPAIAKLTMIPVMNCIWFTGTRALAYDGYVSLSVPFKTTFRGAVYGQTLIHLLRKSRAKEVDFIPSDEVLQIKAASTLIKMDLMLPSSFIHEQPQPTGHSLPISINGFITRLRMCMKSVSNDTTDLNHLGVTLIAKGQELLLFATNRHTISHAKVKLSGSVAFERVVLSSEFCERFLRLTKSEGHGELEIHKDYSLYSTPKGTVLYGKCIDVMGRPYKYEETLEYNFPKTMLKHLSPITYKLKDILDRAVFITGNSYDNPQSTTITVKDCIARFVSRSDKGKVIDVMSMEGNQPDARIVLDCKYLMVGMDTFDNMLVTDKCFIMTKGDMVYLIATDE